MRKEVVLSGHGDLCSEHMFAFFGDSPEMDLLVNRVHPVDLTLNTGNFHAIVNISHLLLPQDLALIGDHGDMGEL